jgi:SAM-dependent methyltransferase
VSYWISAADDEDMQDDHGFIWRAMLDTIDVDLAGCRVLDAGCNRGGLLRLLADTAGIAEGFGYDPADGAIADARRLAGRRRLLFQAAESVPAGWTDFDVAFSHEVLYLVADLRAHAAAVHRSLRPGGVYFAVTGVHAGSPLMVEWHAANREALGMPPMRSVEEIVGVFQGAGFEVSLARLAFHFIPATGRGHHEEGRLLDWLSYYYDQKLLLRCVPTEAPTVGPTVV